MFTPAKVETFTSVTRRVQNADGTTNVHKPSIALDDAINAWAAETGVVILSTALTAFSVVEHGANDTVVRRTVTVSQVVYLPEAAYYEREARIRSAAMVEGGAPTCSCGPRPTPVSDTQEARASRKPEIKPIVENEAGFPPEMRIVDIDELGAGEFEL